MVEKRGCGGRSDDDGGGGGCMGAIVVVECISDLGVAARSVRLSLTVKGTLIKTKAPTATQSRKSQARTALLPPG